MTNEIQTVRIGLAIILIGLFLGVGMGISFGINEDAYKDFVAEGIAAHPTIHDENSQSKIWRYAQRAHFHSNGISAFSLGLVILVMFSAMKARMKAITAILIGLGSLYPLAWFSMFFLAPSIGRDPAHEHILTKMFTFVGVGGLLLGSILLVASLFFGGSRGEANV